jgi:excisionase family DNA binding protein
MIQEAIMKKRKQPQSIACPQNCDRLHNLSQVSYLLSVSEDTVRREINDGKLMAVFVRRRRMVAHSEIKAYLMRNAA